MEFDVYLRFLLALAFVLGLIAALAWAARRFGLGGGFAPMKGRSARLAVVEATMLDAKRRLVLIRRDDREHLLLLGPTGETVVEAGIAAAATPVTLPAPAAAAAEEQP
jgi:flagellar protein FliO/FliZ